MSAPDTNALSPAPVSTTTLTSSSACSARNSGGQRGADGRGEGIVLGRVVERHERDAVVDFAEELLGARVDHVHSVMSTPV